MTIEHFIERLRFVAKQHPGITVVVDDWASGNPESIPSEVAIENMEPLFTVTRENNGTYIKALVIAATV